VVGGRPEIPASVLGWIGYRPGNCVILMDDDERKKEADSVRIRNEKEREKGGAGLGEAARRFSIISAAGCVSPDGDDDKPLRRLIL
jgi:hypothetical protein